MLVLNSQLLDVPIMSLQSGGSLGVISQEIIDPRMLKVVAYYITGPRITQASVLHTDDIREYGPLGFIVDSADNIMELDDDLVRLREVIELGFDLVGKTVIDDTNKRLGKVVEYAIDSETFMVSRLHVSQSVIKNITNTNLVVGRQQIIEVNNRSIIVKSATIPDATSLMSAINPFRKPQVAPTE